MASVWAELKRRNVVRVAIAYVIAGWLILQFADVLVPLLTLPEWVGRLVFLLLLVGLPLALFFAWAYELTPEGIKKEKVIDRSESVTHVTARKLDLIIIAVLVVALLMFAVDKFVRGPDSVTARDSAQGIIAVEDQQSIAVLPFVNMSPEPDQEYFSDGLSEEILNLLAKIPELKVAGRTSSFVFKGKSADLRQIGVTLGVAYVLEGSVRKDGTQLRITAQLINVDDGFHVWSETYDRELTDIFSVQDEISSAIVEQLKLNWLEGAPSLAGDRNIDVNIYELFLKGRELAGSRVNAELLEARVILEDVVRRSPNFAPAMAALARTIILLGEGGATQGYGSLSMAEVSILANPLVDRAIVLDPNLADAHAARGHILFSERKNADAEASYLRAVEINPSQSDAWNRLSGIAADRNDYEQSLKFLETANAIDPLWLPPSANLMFQYFELGRRDEMWAILDRLSPFYENSASFQSMVMFPNFVEGKLAAALRASQFAFENSPGTPYIAEGYFETLWVLQEFEQAKKVLPEVYSYESAFVTGAWDVILPLLAQSLNQNPLQTRRLHAFLSGSILIGDFESVVKFYDTHIRQPSTLSDSGMDEYLLSLFAFAMDAQGRLIERDAILRGIEADLRDSDANGINNAYQDQDWARYFSLTNQRDEALEKLRASISRGLFVADWAYEPEFAPLATDPQFEEIKQQNLDGINRERAKLGLGPVKKVGL